MGRHDGARAHGGVARGFDGVAATGATNSPLEQRERSADELILAGVRTVPSSGVAAARSALA